MIVFPKNFNILYPIINEYLCDNIFVCETAGEQSNAQCCYKYPGSVGQGNYYGFTTDCQPKTAVKSHGCWDQCNVNLPDGRVVYYEAGPCVDGKQILTQKTMKDGVLESESSSEVPCVEILLIPFTSTFVLIINLFIIILFYRYGK